MPTTTIKDLLEKTIKYFKELEKFETKKVFKQNGSKSDLKTFYISYPRQIGLINVTIKMLMRTKYCVSIDKLARFESDIDELFNNFKIFIIDYDLIPLIKYTLNKDIDSYRSSISWINDSGPKDLEPEEYWSLLDNRDLIESKIDFLKIINEDINEILLVLNETDNKFKKLDDDLKDFKWITKEYFNVYPLPKYWWRYVGGILDK